MSFRGFEGPAGSGKTHRLMGAVLQRLNDHPILPHQRILALTFMHGSRRRLEAEFGGNPQLRGKAVAMTIDSFANHVWNRWRTLAGSLNAEIGDFDQTCDACGRLLEQAAVARWVARSFPIIVVDEAQELAAPRLRMISALAPHSAVIVAADEFQCLEENLNTAPFMEWFATGEITSLNQIHRTNQAGLLAAGANLRQLIAPVEGPGLSIGHVWSNLVPFRIGSAIRAARGSVVILYPPAGAQWAQALALRLAQGLHSNHYNIPPIYLAHEPRASDEIEAAMAALGDIEGLTSQELRSRIELVPNQPLWMPRVQSSIRASAEKVGKENWAAGELRALLDRTAANYRAYSADRSRGVPLLSIHGAKNRQFDHVIILWPHGVPGSDEFKARLLYNGITRARLSCKVFVRSPDLLNASPFTFVQQAAVAMV